MKNTKKTKVWLGAIDERGRVTIPVEIRRHLALRPGARVEFMAGEGPRHVRLFRVRTRTNPFEEYAGILGTFPGGVEGIDAWLRDLRDE